MEIKQLPNLSGYDHPEPFPDRPNWLEYSRIILCMFVFAYFMFDWVVSHSLFFQLTNIMSVFLLFALLTLPHEGIHKLIAEKNGYDAEMHFFTIYPHNIIEEQKITVEDYVQILLAPIKYMTIPILLLIILVQVFISVSPSWIDVTGILTILLFTHVASCADDVHQWRYLKSNYSLDDVVYMISDTKDSFFITFPFFQSGYYRKIDD